MPTNQQRLLKALPLLISGVLFATIMRASAADHVVGGGLYDIIVGDFDGDQMSDVIQQGINRKQQHSAVLAAVQQAGVQRWRDGFLNANWNREAAQLVVGDFNGDAGSDVIVQSTNPLALATVIHSYADGHLGLPVQTIGAWYLGLQWDAAHHRLFAADFNGDGRDDVFLQGQSNGDRHAVALASDNGTFERIAFDFDSQHLNRDWAASKTTIVTGDFDGNGNFELLLQPATSEESTLVVGSSSTRPLDAVQTTIPAQHLNLDWSSGRHRVVVGDFNGDGKDDVFLLASHLIEQSIYLPSAGERFDRIDRVIEHIPNLDQLKQVLVGDFDADGVDDLILLFNDPRLSPMVLLADAARAARLQMFLRKLGLLTEGQTLRYEQGKQPEIDGNSGTVGAGFPSTIVNSATSVRGQSSTNPAALSKVSKAQKIASYSSLAEPAWQEFGSSGGQFRVDESGAATFTVPLAVAPGSGGVAPTLSLRYSSQAGNGPLGLGWNLAGLSSISRCRATRETDGFDGDITFSDDDKFCFDGQRLVDVTATSGGWVYRTEIDSFARITASGGTKGNPERFVVERKDGSKSYYGSKASGVLAGSDSSRVQMSGGSHDDQVMTWSISRFEDSVGNFINYGYFKSAAEHRITTIQYGGVGQTFHSQVLFSYEDRPDKRKSYSYGGVFDSYVRLKRVTSTSTDFGGAPAEQRRYELFYNNTGSTENSRLEYLQECRASTCLPAIKFDWLQNDAPSLWTAPANTGSTFSHRYAGGRAADLNGDGNSDLAWIMRDSESRYYWLHTWIKDPTGGAEFLKATPTRIPLPRWGLKTWHLFDYNNDGRADLLFRPCTLASTALYCSEWASKWVIALANADGSLPSPTVTGSTVAFPTYVETGVKITYGEESELADFNGDGLPDLLSFSSSGDRKLVTVSLLGQPGINGHVCAAPASAAPYCFGAQIPLTLSVQTTLTGVPSGTRCGERLPAPVYTGAAIDTADRPSISVLDMNGDSAADLIVTAQYLVSTWTYPISGSGTCDTQGTQITRTPTPVKRVFLSKLNSSTPAFSEATAYAAKFDTLRSIDDELTRFTDMNGDGLTDFVYADGDTSWGVVVNTGEGFDAAGGTYYATGISSDINHKKRLMTADLNSDGLPDIVFPKDGDYRVAYQQGDRTFAAPVLTGAYSEHAGDRSDVFADFNGDGKPDKVELLYDAEGENHGEQRMQFFGNAGRAHNVIRGIRLPAGAVTSIEYAPLTNSAIYSRGTPLSRVSGRGSPIFDPLTPMYVVSRVSSSAPTAGTSPQGVDLNAQSAVRYTYTGLKMQSGGRGSLGFQSLTTADEQTGVVTTTTYEQAFPFTGMPIKTTKTTAGGLLFSESVNVLKKYSEKYGGQSTYLEGDFPLVESATDRTRDINGTDVTGFLGKTVTETGYDRYGNVSQIKVSTKDGWGSNTDLQTKTTVNSYGSSVDEGMFGRLSNTEITTTRPGTGTQTRRSAYRYGAYRQLSEEIIEPAGNEKEYLRTVYDFDGFGNRKKTTVCSNHVAACGTDASQQPDNPYFINRSATVEYDPYGRFAVKKFNHYGQLLEHLRAWNTAYQPTEVAGPTGIVKRFQYTDFGRLWRESDNTGTTGSWSESSMESCSRVACIPGASYRVAVVSSGKPSSIQYFDILGREIATQVDSLTQRATGYLTKYTEYDRLSRVRRVSLPHFSTSPVPGWEQTDYDILGRATRITHATGKTAEIDYLGLTTTKTNELGQRKREQRNALGELSSVIDNQTGLAAEQATLTFRYDIQGQLAKLYRANSSINLQSDLTYDLRGRKVRMWDADKSLAGGFWVYDYNAVGELIKQTDARGHSTENRYDALGRLISRSEKSNTGVVLSSASWVYELASDKPGLLRSDSALVPLSETGTMTTYQRSYSYDGLGRATAATHQLEGKVYTETTEYDPTDGRMTVKRDITGKGLRYIYTPSNYLNEIQDADNDSIVFQRVQEMDAYGNITRETLGNGAVISRSFQPLTGRLSDLVTTRGAEVQNLHYEWNDIGNLTLRRDTSADKYQEESFSYDGLNRLTRAYAGAIDKEVITTYDIEGNIKTKSDVGSDVYGYGGTCNSITAGPHAVTSVGSKSYCYDQNGNMVSGDGRSLTYNNTFDLPTKVVGGNHTTFYSYGIDHARFKRVDRKVGEADSTVWYIGSVEIVKKPDGNTEFRRAIPNGIVTNGNPSYILKDHIGSTDVILDCVGKIIEAHSFDAWGKQRNADTWKLRSGMWAVAWPGEMLLPKSPLLSPRTGAKTIHGFTGHEMVDELGLIHMNGRMYDPHLGRFLQADPIIQAPTMSQSLNRYSYIINNPLSGTDPSGFSWWMEHREETLQVVAWIVRIIGYFTGGWGEAFWQAWQAISAARAAYYAMQSGQGVRGAFTSMAVSYLAKQTIGDNWYGDAMAGGINAEMQGGKFGHGFVIAGAMSAGNSYAKAMTVGQTASPQTGGKSANGAGDGATTATKEREGDSGGPFTRRAITRERLNELVMQRWRDVDGVAMGYEELGAVLHDAFKDIAARYDIEIGAAIFQGQGEFADRYFAKNITFAMPGEGTIDIPTTYESFSLAGDFHTHGRGDQFYMFSTRDFAGAVVSAQDRTAFRGSFLTGGDGVLRHFDAKGFVNSSVFNPKDSIQDFKLKAETYVREMR